MSVPPPLDTRGSLDLLMLKSLALAPMHGWGIGQRLEQLSAGALLVSQGSLYPALQRLEHQGLITSDWHVTENNRRARVYTLTRSGHRALDTETESWERLVSAVALVLRAT